MNELAEAMKGFTDVPISLIALILAIIAKKKNGRKEWVNMLFFVSVTALFGAVVHAVKMPHALQNIIWIFLYVLLFETVRRVGVAFCSYSLGTSFKEKPLTVAVEALFYILSVVWLYISNGTKDIYFFAAFACLCVLRVVVCFAKTKKVPRKALVLIVSVSVPLLLQILCEVIPYAVVIEHIFLAFELFIAYLIAVDNK